MRIQKAITGTDRRDMVIKTLEPFKREIRKAVAGKQVIIKPNNVWDGIPLCATHPDAMRGILDFLKPIYDRQVIIAESTTSPKGTLVTFEQYKYLPLAREYNVRLVDLNDSATTTVYWLMGKTHHPMPIRVIDAFLDPNAYFISVTRLKTHDTVVATLSAKNMIMAAPWTESREKNDKPKMHAGFKEMNWNMFQLAHDVHPQLAILDGLEGMEGNGPIRGTPVEHGVALAGTDYVAVDRIGVELMGIDFSDVGYLSYCMNAGLGQGDRSKIDIVGPDPSDHVIKYKLHDRIEEQLTWKETS